MTEHGYSKRIAKELDQCVQCYTDVVRDVKVPSDAVHRWSVKLVNGVKLELFIGGGFPFTAPVLQFKNFYDHHGLIKCQCESAWTTASRVGKFLVNVYTLTETVFEEKRRRLRFMGLLRTVPLMLLWRKRATERLYHPSMIDFESELNELNLLLL